jgi:hypothetical protein
MTSLCSFVCCGAQGEREREIVALRVFDCLREA